MTKKKKQPNPLHLQIQTKYRVLVEPNKKKYNRKKLPKIEKESIED